MTNKEKVYETSHWRFTGRQKRVVPSTTSSYNTILDVTDKEAAALEIIGHYLFGCRLTDWKPCKDGKSDAERKKNIGRLVGDRYAYGIVRLNNDQLRLQKGNIKRDRELKEKENKAFDKRIKQAESWLAEHPGIVDDRGKYPKKKDYDPLSYEEWGRYRHNESVIAKYDMDGYVGVTFGGKTRQRVAVRAMQKTPDDEETRSKHHDWKLSRYNIYAVGDCSHACGNSIIRLDENGGLRILVPAAVRGAVEEALGEPLDKKKYLTLSSPVRFHYGWDVLLSNIEHNHSVSSSITYEPDNRSWRLTCTANADVETNILASAFAVSGGSVAGEDGQSFAAGRDNPAVAARLAKKSSDAELKKATVSSAIDRSKIAAGDRRRFMGIDVNYGHIDLVVCDVHGNPCGAPLTIPFATRGNDKQLKSSLLHALDRVKHICSARHVECVFIEDLKGFSDSKSRVLNGGGRDFRRWVNSIPSGSFREWLSRKVSSISCHVELVPAAYTSQAASVFWFDVFSCGHHGAALMIARRGLGLGLFRRVPASPKQSGVTVSECLSVDSLAAGSDAVSGVARARLDCGEVAGSPATDICNVLAGKSDLCRVFRRSTCLCLPGSTGALP